MTIATKSHGTLLAIASFGTVAEVGDIKGPELSRDDIDVTSHDSPADYEELIGGLKKSGDVSFKINWAPGDGSHAALWDAYGTGALTSFTLTTPAGSVLAFDANVSGIGPDFPVNGVVSCDIKLKVTGEVVLTP
jgi:predicted secreted protein